MELVSSSSERSFIQSRDIQAKLSLLIVIRRIGGDWQPFVDSVALSRESKVAGFEASVRLEFFWDSVITRSQSMQISETYLAIPQVALPAGAFLMALQFTSEFLKTVLVLKDDTGGLEILSESGDLGR